MKFNYIFLSVIMASIILFPAAYGEVSVNDGATYIENQYIREDESKPIHWIL